MLILIDFMADVKPILSIYYLDRCYCQELWQILLPIFGQMLLPLLFEVVISHFLTDIGSILLNSVLADVITKIYGRSYCQNYFGQMLLP